MANEEILNERGCVRLYTYVDGRTSFDIIAADHLLQQMALRLNTSREASVSWLRSLLMDMLSTEDGTEAIADISRWRGFPQQPRGLISAYLLINKMGMSIPVGISVTGDRMVFKTLMVKEPGQRHIPCGGERRMSMVVVLDKDNQIRRLLKIGIRYMPDTPENRKIKWGPYYNNK